VAARSSSAPRTADRELYIRRMFDAPRALVFKAWTESAQAAHWWGPQGFEITSCTMDVRPGGTYRIAMRSPQGTVHTKRGVYREVVPDERLVFTYAWEDAAGELGHETVVTVRFADEDGKTRLTLHQAFFESVASRDSHQGGWTSCMDRFAQYLTRG